MAKKRIYQKKSFESAGDKSDVSANLYSSMLQSRAWLDLSPKQQVLYLFCKWQYYKMKEPQKKALFDAYTDLTPPPNVQEFFSLSAGSITKDYPLYTNLSSFYRDRDALISHGFIRVIADGRFLRQKSIYRYSDKWKKWGTEDFKIEPKEMSTTLLRSYRSKKEGKMVNI